jgi:hypothetical protein
MLMPRMHAIEEFGGVDVPSSGHEEFGEKEKKCGASQSGN